MLISPPFLPARGNDTEDAYLARAMPAATHGVYPVSDRLAWHGGLHLVAPAENNQTLPVRAIADGTVVYVRQPTQQASTGEDHPLRYNGWTDNGVVILRHDTEIGATNDGTATAVRFYSIYVHLSEIATTVQPDQSIERKARIGRAGIFENNLNCLHFEIVCDDENLRRLIGRNADPFNAQAGGRADAVFGEMYFRLPANLQTYPAQPPLTQTTGTDGTDLGEVLCVGIRYGGGNAQITTYREDGTVPGAALTEANAEYNLYTTAGSIVQAYRTARAATVPAQSAVYELLRFGRILGPDALNPADTPHWRQIQTPAGARWVNLNATGLRHFSDADAPPWAGWHLTNDYLDGDSRCDVEAIRSLFTRRPTDSQPQTPAAPTRAQALQSLSRHICKYPTEWHRGSVATRWAWLTREPSEEDANAPPPLRRPILTQDEFVPFRAYAEALCFWEDANTGLEQNHWHFHPLEFIRLFRRCGWFSESELRNALRSAPTEGQSRATNMRLPMNKVFRKYLVNSTPLRTSHFLAQVGIETLWWQFREEIGNERYFRTMYEVITAQEAAEDFRSGFAQRLGLVRRGDTEETYSARRPGEVATKAAGMDNGIANTARGGQVGDGPRFRGRGFLQITGRKNYTKYGLYRGIDFTTDPNPSALANHYNSSDASGYYWARESINAEASVGATERQVDRVGGIVNRGNANRQPLHRVERRVAFANIWGVLNDTP